MAEKGVKEPRRAARRTATRAEPVQDAADAARRAADSLSELTGYPSEGCSEVAPADEGWRVCVDVVEVRRIPDTTSLLATYEVALSQDGSLRSYRRVNRYRRGAADS